MVIEQPTVPDSYVNPVFPHSFPDPFILKFRGEYFAYCTGHASDGRVFSVLRSDNLVDWTALAGAMEPLTTGEPFYWAPEVTYRNGKFYLYYSVGNEALMEIRVATSDRPDGGFIDAGVNLTSQDFAIDPHVFCNADGAAYMFYATDFLDGSHVGTGTVVDLMLDPFTLSGDSRTVTRAKYDWQVYDPKRKEKCGVRWHTVEGPFVLERKGTYYEMFSGGNWQNTSYGVSVAVTKDIEGEDEWIQHCDGIASLPLLRTIPDKVIGPGHNSAILGPNNRELYCIYHRWVGGERVMALDRMDFAGGDRIFLVGPTWSPQKAPIRPTVADCYWDFGEHVRVLKGAWAQGNRSIVSDSTGVNEIVYKADSESFLVVVALRTTNGEHGTFGICLTLATGQVAQLFIDPAVHSAVWKQECETKYLPLPPDFDYAAWHEMRVEVDGMTVKASLDRNVGSFKVTFNSGVREISLFAAECPGAEFSAFTLTEGFEELFENDELSARSWQVDAADGAVRLENKCLLISAPSMRVSLTKIVPAGNFDLAINVRVENDLNSNSSAVSFGCGEIVSLRKAASWQIVTRSGEWELPKGFTAESFHQFRLLRTAGNLEVYLEDILLGSPSTNSSAGPLEIVVENTVAMLDMVRFTGLR